MANILDDRRVFPTCSDTLGREFDSGKRDFSHKKLKNQNKNAQRVEND